jgi:hypothetical protein
MRRGYTNDLPVSSAGKNHLLKEHIMKRVVLGVMVFAAAVLFFACPLPTPPLVPPPGPPEEPIPEPPPPENPASGVYVAGYYVSQDNRKIPCYWDQNGNRVDLNLDGANQGEAVVITAFQGNLYIAGFYYDGTSGGKPCRWDKDGNKTNINVAGTVRFFTFYGSDVYMAGTDTENAPCYWNPNGGKTLLEGCQGVKGIAVRNSGNVFVAGYITNNQVQERPYIWANGQRSEQLGNSGTPNNMNVYVTGIAVSASQVYVSGHRPRFWDTDPWYWAGVGEPTLLTRGGGNHGTTSGAVFADNHLYVLGLVDNTYCYWVDGTKKDLPSGSSISSLTASGGAVYIAGSSSGPCYWDGNGVKTALTTDGKGGAAHSITIAN